MLTAEDVKKIAALARIEIGEHEVEKFQKELSSVLDYVDELNQVNVDGLEEVSQVTGLVNVQREDVVVDHGNREEIFSQAPEMKDGYFKVKSIL
jgi:aspartyl-tRNA(Asn)/glutamyl-tRNA(Gln) amidotransferase subunit C